MLPHHKEIIRATVPALQAHGEAITQTFYREMFSAHPELLNLFNPANQRNGGQARSLAASILSYAANIDRLDQLGGMVERIAHKHASLEIRPEHYPIVGKHLLQAIAIVLGDAATPEVLEAWSLAYQQLAQIMIGREQELYTEGANQPGGWRGYKPFLVQRKVEESDSISSFYLVPKDGEPLPPFRSGQYISLKFHVPGEQYEGIRQYSLSHVWDEAFYRISVKREMAPLHQSEAPDGLVSNHLHDEIHEGDTVLVHVPQGDFILDEDSNRPVVLLSAGSGITPALCMLQSLAEEEKERPVLFVHATSKRAHHAFGKEVRQIEEQNSNIKAVVFYGEVGRDDVRWVDYDEVGRITPDALRPYLPSGEADYYYCGPVGFISAVESLLNRLAPGSRRYSEAFAPDPSFLLELASA